MFCRISIEYLKRFKVVRKVTMREVIQSSRLYRYHLLVLVYAYNPISVAWVNGRAVGPEERIRRPLGWDGTCDRDILMKIESYRKLDAFLGGGVVIYSKEP